VCSTLGANDVCPVRSAHALLSADLLLLGVASSATARSFVTCVPAPMDSNDPKSQLVKQFAATRSEGTGSALSHLTDNPFFTAV
jgi:hypothetical protein